jgi:predicted nucleotide-binding protein
MPGINKTTLFVGSSSEGLELARAERSLLTDDAELTLWNEGLFRITDTFIESLVNALPRFDFTTLVLSTDDLTISRNIATP